MGERNRWESQGVSYSNAAWLMMVVEDVGGADVHFQGGANRISDRVNVRCECERGLKEPSKIFGLSSWRDRVAIYCSTGE